MQSAHLGGADERCSRDDGAGGHRADPHCRPLLLADLQRCDESRKIAAASGVPTLRTVLAEMPSRQSALTFIQALSHAD
jgi:hypothetical protein